jgi:2',3'-cyclic-nucleotide 2'-phosphodiesterase (5'-nucleotidase family)
VRRARALVLFVSAALLTGALAVAPSASAVGPVSFTILHTNDFHGQLEPSGSNPGMARVSAVVNDIRAAKGAANVLLVDAGDEMQGSLLSNLQKGEPTIAAFDAMDYAVATFGNHEFDWGKTVLGDRTAQATYPFVTANIVVNDTGSCATAGWTPPSFADGAYQVETVAGVRVGFIGVTTQEVPTITIASATEGLCFKDPAESILHYYDALKANADVIVVLSHLGLNDGGYGYGIPVYGDKTLAQKLIDAGKPAALIVGGHSHTNMASTGATVVGGKTTVVQAYYSGRQVGQADMTFDPGSGATTVAWKTNAVSTSGAMDPAIDSLIGTYANDPAYQALINTPVGYVQTDLLRNYNGDSMMGDFIDDAIYGALNSDATAANDVDLFFNNAGGIRTDWCDAPDPTNPGQFIWSNDAANCQPGAWSHDPMLLNYGQMFLILPFGNATVVGDMTGAQILQVLNQSATLGKGAIQPSGVRYSFYRYSDSSPGPQPYAWGAFDACIVDRTTGDCDPIDLSKTYRVGTNEFLAPAGGDNYAAFKYMTNISYWGDMLDAVNAYVSAHYTLAEPYRGPDGDGMLDGRISRDGTDAAGSGSIVPITILHNNDSHGNLAKGQYVGYTQLASLIKQEQARNPGRTLLLDAGDQIQGDAMMYYFKTSYSGFASDGTPLPAELQTNPMMAVMNALGYDAMTLGNHEFNFGGDVFKGVLGQADFPILGANVSDDGSYGLAAADGGQGVQPYIEVTLDGVKVAILGITNHRVPNYELPSNIEGLTFSDPIAAGDRYAPDLKATDDVVIALTHIGFTEDPKSVEVDKNVDTNFAAEVPGVDAIIGGHSHTNPVTAFGDYKFLPTIVAGPGNAPVIINQAYRYNNYLGEVVLGVRAKAGGGYEVVSRAGQYIAVTSSTPEDPAIKAIVDPYMTQLSSYYDKVVGQTTAPIDTLAAFTEETNGANLQADASVFELAQHGITDVDIHISGAMTNKLVATGATEADPVTLKVSDMFAAMPYENSLVVMRMNGPQLKSVLERAYRNYYYYKYVPGYGGYSHYTTCMLDTNSVGKITYNDLYPAAYDPSVDHVVSLEIGGTEVDFTDATKYYNVSTVNYLAAGSCNFNDNGVSLWPLDQIVHDTQYYVRDAVIDYITAMGTVSPAIEGRLAFITDTTGPDITIESPTSATYLHSDQLTVTFSATDEPAGVRSVTADIDGTAVTSGQTIDLVSLALGEHTLTVQATDRASNASTKAVTFSVEATTGSLRALVEAYAADGSISKDAIAKSLLSQLDRIDAAIAAGQAKTAVNQLNAFANLVSAQTGKSITPDAAAVLLADAAWVSAHLT